MKDFYHGFVIPDAHAARNHIHGVFRGSAFRGFRAYKPATLPSISVSLQSAIASLVSTSFALELLVPSSLAPKMGKPAQHVVTW